MKPALKVLLLFNAPYFCPRGYEFKQEFADPNNMYTEKDVYQALLDNGYGVRVLGLYNDLSILLEEVKENRPDVIFNMVDMFAEKTRWDKNAAAFIEMLGIPFTGCSPAALMICNDKALTKKILTFHRIRTPHFHVFLRNERIRVPAKFRLPAIVKPLSEEASRGISQASVVDDPAALVERVRFIHQKMELDAIVEEYVDGREMYVSVMGRKKLDVLPLRELNFGQLPEDEPRIATYKAKWDDIYRDRWGIKSVAVGRLAEGLESKIHDVAKRAYRALGLDAYARFDIRVTAQGEVFIIEANANPCVAKVDELALSAEKSEIPYAQLIARIVEQGINHARGA